MIILVKLLWIVSFAAIAAAFWLAKAQHDKARSVARLAQRRPVAPIITPSGDNRKELAGHKRSIDRSWQGSKIGEY